MASGTSQEQDEEITGINVTPLVDVMLVLLVIFMVTANYIVNQTIPIKLPKAAAGSQDQASNLAFVLDAQSHVYLDGQPTRFEELGSVLQRRLEKNPQLQALISADEKTPHGSVVKLIDILRKNGIYDFAISVEVEQ